MVLVHTCQPSCVTLIAFLNLMFLFFIYKNILASFRYNLHITLWICKVYNVMIWYTNMLQNDYQNMVHIHYPKSYRECVCVCVLRTSKIYSLKKFQVHNMVLLNIIIVLNVRSLEIIHLNHWKRDHLHPFPSCFPGDSLVKNLPANAGEESSITGSGRFPGEGNGYPLQYSCLENPMDRGAWWATVHGVTRAGHDLTTKPALLSIWYETSIFWPYGSSIFNFLRNVEKYTVFHRGCNSLPLIKNA